MRQSSPSARSLINSSPVRTLQAAGKFRPWTERMAGPEGGPGAKAARIGLFACVATCCVVLAIVYTGARAAEPGPLFPPDESATAGYSLDVSQTLLEGALSGSSSPAECPLRFDRPSLGEIRHKQAKPYVFGGLQRPVCSNCHTEQGKFCRYVPGTRPMCPQEDQDRLLNKYLAMEDAGSAFATNLLRFTPCDLWPFLRGRTLWLVGDSITQEWLFALECFMLEFWDLSTGSANPVANHSLPSADQAAIKDAMTWADISPRCINMLEKSRICFVRNNMGDALVEHVLPMMKRLSARRTDIYVGNFALWINNATEYVHNLGLVRAYVARHRAELPFLIWREASAQHFVTPAGDFADAKKPYKCQPIGGWDDAVRLLPSGALWSTRPDLQVVLEGGWRNRIARPIMAALGIPIVPVWNHTVPLHGYHHHYSPGCANEEEEWYCSGDCTHTCHPSMYQIWIYQLYETLMASRPQLDAHMRRMRLWSA